MASTTRESTAHCGGESHFDSIGSAQIPALGLGSHLSILDTTICQQTASLALPICGAMLSCIAAVADTAHGLHNRANGSTVSLVHGNMVGWKLFSVSVYPSRSITLWERPSWEELFDYVKANLDLILRPGHALGTWFNDYKLVHCLDVVVLVRDRNEAMELGFRFNQVAIFDLEARREISIRLSSQGHKNELAGGGQ